MEFAGLQLRHRRYIRPSHTGQSTLGMPAHHKGPLFPTRNRDHKWVQIGYSKDPSRAVMLSETATVTTSSLRHCSTQEGFALRENGRFRLVEWTCVRQWTKDSETVHIGMWTALPSIWQKEPGHRSVSYFEQLLLSNLSITFQNVFICLSTKSAISLACNSVTLKFAIALLETLQLDAMSCGCRRGACGTPKLHTDT